MSKEKGKKEDQPKEPPAAVIETPKEAPKQRYKHKWTSAKSRTSYNHPLHPNEEWHVCTKCNLRAIDSNLDEQDKLDCK